MVEKSSTSSEPEPFQLPRDFPVSQFSKVKSLKHKEFCQVDLVRVTQNGLSVPLVLKSYDRS
jgi:serine/threonine protein kinase